jgi:tetratricopeptide (TPR) repeat protein
VVAVALVLGVAVGTWQAIRATRAERRAASALATAEAQRRQARRAVDEMYTQFVEQVLADQPRLEQVHRRFLERALAYYEQFAREVGADVAVRREVGKAYRRAGEIRARLGHEAEAEAAFRRGIEIFERLAAGAPGEPEDRRELAACYRGRAPLSRENDHLRRALAIRAKLVADHPSVAAYRRELAATHYELGAGVGAGQLFSSESARAREAHLRDALEHQEALVREAPGEPDDRKDLAATLRQLGQVVRRGERPAEAVAYYRRSLDLLEELIAGSPGRPVYRQDLADTCHALGQYQVEQRQFAEAEPLLRRAAGLLEGLAADFPSVPRYGELLVWTDTTLAEGLSNSGRAGDASDVLRRAVGVARKLNLTPPHAGFTNGAVIVHHRLARLLLAAGRQAELEQFARETSAFAEELARALPANPLAMEYLSGLLTHWPDPRTRNATLAVELARKAVELDPGDFHRWEALSSSCRAAGDLEGAIRAQQRVVALRQGPHPGPGGAPPGQWMELTSKLRTLGEMYRQAGRPRDAEATYRRVLDVIRAQESREPDPRRSDTRGWLANTHWTLAQILREAGRLEAAEESCRQAVAIQEGRVADFPDRPDESSRLAACLDEYGALLRDSGRYAEAERVLRRAIAGCEKPAAASPGRYAPNVIEGHIHLGLVLRALGRPSEAEQSYRQALDWAGRLVAATRTAPENRARLATIRLHLGDLLHSVDRHPEAEQAFREARTILEERVADSPEVRRELARHLADCPLPQLRDVGRAVRLAEEDVAARPNVGDAWRVLGLARHRAGDWKGAIEALERGLPLQSGGRAIDGFFLAMARWQLGEKDEARRQYDRAVERMKKHRERDDVVRHRDEAAGLLGVEAEPSTSTRRMMARTR